jgi:predicted N-formylglutamate amidohydrolase
MDTEPNVPRAQQRSKAAEIVNPGGASDFVLVCDHASNAIPAEYGTLGLDRDHLREHIAWDIGAAAVTRRLAERLDAPAILSRFSRLVIDPNRMPDDPSLIVTVTHNVAVPGNMSLTPSDARWRKSTFYDAYQETVGDVIAERRANGRIPALVSIHSFTPVVEKFARPWQIGLLWDRDPRLKDLLYRELSRNEDLVIGDNEPYSGQGAAGTMELHGMQCGLPHILIEIRQDLIGQAPGAERWSGLLGDALEAVIADRSILAVRHYR